MNKTQLETRARFIFENFIKEYQKSETVKEASNSENKAVKLFMELYYSETKKRYENALKSLRRHKFEITYQEFQNLKESLKIASGLIE